MIDADWVGLEKRYKKNNDVGAVGVSCVGRVLSRVVDVIKQCVFYAREYVVDVNAMHALDALIGLWKPAVLYALCTVPM